MNIKNFLFNNYDDLKCGTEPKFFNLKNYVPYFKSLYDTVILHELMKEMSYKNHLMVPILDKIVISSSFSTLKHGNDKNMLIKIYNSLYLMTGVKPMFTRSSVAISQFKLQKNSITGCKVTLRRNYVYEFLERLVNIYLPSVKGFLGISESSVSKNTLSIGIKDIHVVCEVTNYLGLVQFGCTITICVKNTNNALDTIRLLKKFDIPIKKEL